MKLVSTLRRLVPLLILLGFLAGTSSCLLRTERTGNSRGAVHHAKHKHRHCHEKKQKNQRDHRKHKKHKKQQVCHSHVHGHPHH